MRIETSLLGNLATKLIACLLIVLCFAVGAVGLVLPIIPGLLFVALALMLLARCFPSIDERLRRNRTMKSYLDRSDGFLDLSLGKKVQYGLFLCLQLFVDAIALLVYAASKLLGFAVGRYQSYR